jgi:hypothetical protein
MKRLMIIVLLIFVGIAASANQVPSGEDIALTVWANSSIPFSVIVQDADIDPAAPEVHPMAFSVGESPEHGVVTGDFEQVLYYTPATAALVLTYIPAADFTGYDSLTLLAEDSQGGLETIRVTIEVRTRGATASLTGTFLATTTLDVEAGLFTTTNVAGTVGYSVYATSMTMGYLLKKDGPPDEMFDDLYFTLVTPFAGFASLAGRLDLNPETTSDLFDYASLSLAVHMLSTSLSATARTDGTQTQSSLVLALAGSGADSLSFSSSATFGLCEPLFSNATVSARFQLACGQDACSIPVSATASFTCDGFAGASISTSGVQFPDIAWLSFVRSAGVTISYNVQTKSVSISPQFSTSWVNCIRIGTKVNWSEKSYEGIEFQSIHMDCTFSNGVRFRMDTSFEPTNLTLNQTVTGHLDYWEKDRISGQVLLCDGIRMEWDIAAYFSRPLVGTSLFSWGMLELKLDVSCYQAWRIFTEITFRSGVFGGSTCELLLGAEVDW